jgi:hypothetical protein
MKGDSGSQKMADSELGKNSSGPLRQLKKHRRMMFTGWELPSALYVLASTNYWRSLLIEYVLSSLDKLI